MKILVLLRKGCTGGEPTGTRCLAEGLERLCSIQISEIKPCYHEIIKSILQFKPDVVLTSAAVLHYKTSVICKLMRIRHLWWQQTPFTKSRKELFLSKLSTVVCLSKYIRNNRNHPVVYAPLKFEKPQEPYFEKNSQPVIGYVASYQKRKRPDLFVEIAGYLNNQLNKNCRFVMAGRQDFWTYDGIETLAKSKGIWIAQFQEKSDAVTRIIPYLDCMVVPATQEGLGRTLQEAAYYDIPFVAFDDGGHREIAEHLGCTDMLVQSDDIKEWCEKIEKALNNQPSYNKEFLNKLTPLSAADSFLEIINKKS